MLKKYGFDTRINQPLFVPFNKGQQPLFGQDVTYKVVNKNIGEYLMFFHGMNYKLYGTHSFRRGGCQYLSVHLGWDIKKICDWGAWVLDFHAPQVIRLFFI